MKIVKKEAFKVIGIKVEADWQMLHQVMDKVWERAKERLTEIENRKEDVMMDLSLEVVDGQYTQLVGVEVEGAAITPGGMEEVSIPLQEYIYYQHEGELSGIGQSFGKMYDWAEEHDIEAGDFKIDYGYLPDGSETEHELYVKII